MPELQIITDGSSILRMQAMRDNDFNAELVSEQLHSYLCTLVQYRECAQKYIFYTPNRLCQMPVGPEELKKDRKGFERALTDKFHITWRIDQQAVELISMKNRILQIHKELVKTLGNKAKQIYELSESLQHVSSEIGDGFIETEITKTESLLLITRKELDDANTALQKIANGTFGICTACGENIDIGRLNCVPITPFCKNCA